MGWTTSSRTMGEVEFIFFKRRDLEILGWVKGRVGGVS